MGIKEYFEVCPVSEGTIDNMSIQENDSFSTCSSILLMRWILVILFVGLKGKAESKVHHFVNLVFYYCYYHLYSWVRLDLCLS